MMSLNIKKVGTSSAADEFAIDVHEIRQVFGLFILWRVGSLFEWVHHFPICKFQL